MFSSLSLCGISRRVLTAANRPRAHRWRPAGKYRTTGDQLLIDSAGKSVISFEDYAVAVLDELEHPRHIGRRFGVAY